MRPIDADELLEKQRNMTIYDEGGWDMQVRAVSVEDIENAPAINPEDLRSRGRWLDAHGNHVSFWEESRCEPSCSCFCSECDEWLTASDEYLVSGRYCPNCGAKMEETNGHA